MPWIRRPVAYRRPTDEGSSPRGGQDRKQSPVSHPGSPAPVRRPARPLPPLPQYGGRTPPPLPQPTEPPGWAATAAPPAHDDRYDDWDEPGYHDWESWDEPRRTNRAAIWGFVLAFLVAPAGL